MIEEGLVDPSHSNIDADATNMKALIFGMTRAVFLIICMSTDNTKMRQHFDAAALLRVECQNRSL